MSRLSGYSKRATKVTIDAVAPLRPVGASGSKAQDSESAESAATRPERRNPEVKRVLTAPVLRAIRSVVTQVLDVSVQVAENADDGMAAGPAVGEAVLAHVSTLSGACMALHAAITDLTD